MFSFRNGFYFQISCSGLNFVSDFSAWGGILPGRGRGTWSRVQIVGFCPRRLIFVCRSGLFAPVVLHIDLHGGESRVFAPRSLIHGCRSGPSAPVVLLIELHGCRLRGFAPVGFHGCCPEQRQGPAQLRVLRNSPRAMLLSGLPIIVMTALCTS